MSFDENKILDDIEGLLFHGNFRYIKKGTWKETVFNKLGYGEITYYSRKGVPQEVKETVGYGPLQIYFVEQSVENVFLYFDSEMYEVNYCSVKFSINLSKYLKTPYEHFLEKLQDDQYSIYTPFTGEDQICIEIKDSKTKVTFRQIPFGEPKDEAFYLYCISI